METAVPSQHWQILLHDAGEDIHVSTVVLRRYVHLLDTPIAVSTLTHSVVKRDRVLSEAEGRTEGLAFAAELRRVMSSPEWKTKCENSMLQCEFTADWPKQNRLLHLVYRNLGDRFAYSLSSTRRVYAAPVLSEAKWLQTQLIQSEKTTHASLWDSLIYRTYALFWSPAAYAAGVSVLAPSTSSFNIPGFGNVNIAGTQNQINSIRDQLGTQQLSPQIQNALSTTLQQSAAPAVQDAQNRATAVVDYGRSQALAVEKQAVQDAHGIIDRVTNSRTIFQTLFVGGVAGALGARVGTAVFDFAASGVVSLTSGIYHAIMGTLSDADKELMKKSAGQSFEDLDKASADLTRIEIELDKRVALLGLVSETAAGDLADQVSTALELQGAKYAGIEKQLKEMQWDSPEAGLCALNAGRERSMLETMKQIQLITVGDERTREGICGKINALFREWASAEAKLNNARESLARNSAAIINQMTENLAQAHRDIGSPRRNKNFCKEQLSQIEDLSSNVGLSEVCKRSYYTKHQYDPSVHRDEAYEQRVHGTCLQDAKRRMEQNIEEIRKACDDVSALESKRDHSAGLQNNLMLAQANIEGAKDLLTEISRKDCEQGVVTGQCEGAAGSLSKMRARYGRLYDAASKKCGMKLFRPKSYDASAQVALTDIDPPSSPPTSAVKSPTTADESGAKKSWFNRFVSALWPGNWFK